MRLPNLNGVRAFECAARHLNFRLAAEELNLTQGAVAQQVRNLEASLGQKLFVRKPRGLELTDKGAAYFTEIHAALTRIAQATVQLAPVSRSVVLSVPPSFASMWLMPRLAEFEALHPDIELQVIASEALSDFDTDSVDLVVRQAAPPFAPNLKSVLLAPLNLVAVASPAYLETAPPAGKLRGFPRPPPARKQPPPLASMARQRRGGGKGHTCLALQPDGTRHLRRPRLAAASPLYPRP